MSNLIKEVHLSFKLPFAIELPDGNYPVKGKSYFCTVKLTKLLPKENPSGWSGNAHIPNDRFGHTNYTEVLVVFGTDNPVEMNTTISKSLRTYAIDAMNRILNACRWVFDNFYNHDLTTKDIPSFNYKYINTEGTETTGMVMDMVQPISIGNPFKKPDLERIVEILKNKEDIPLDVELIKNAQDHLTFENYKMATLEIHSAVENVISTKIRSNLENSESEERIENILKKGWGELKTYLKNTTSEEIITSDECVDWRQNCAQLRNKVIHRQYSPSEFEAKSAVDAGKAFIELLKNC